MSDLIRITLYDPKRPRCLKVAFPKGLVADLGNPVAFKFDRHKLVLRACGNTEDGRKVSNFDGISYISPTVPEQSMADSLMGCWTYEVNDLTIQLLDKQ
jgi:hypothetical protein